jgi:hypothetical protein
LRGFPVPKGELAPDWHPAASFHSCNVPLSIASTVGAASATITIPAAAPSTIPTERAAIASELQKVEGLLRHDQGRQYWRNGSGWEQYHRRLLAADQGSQPSLGC